MSLLEKLLQGRVLVLDGGMGTMIQRYKLDESDYRGERFVSWPGQLKGNNDLLNLTQPNIIRSVHEQYLKAGADIIETNSFNANAISMKDYDMEGFVRELNLAAARNACEAVDRYMIQNPGKQCFIAGSVGPTNKAASLSPDMSDPAFRNITFDELYVAYKEQIEALIEGGVDALLVETAFDTLNVKAALMAADDVFRERRPVDLMLSYTLAGKSGRILSGQTMDAALASIAHVHLLSIGLNCSFGANDMKPFLKELGCTASCYISAHPNAGLPNSMGQYDETPESMADQVREFLDEGLVNIIGGCCGTTPEHIAAISKLVSTAKNHVSLLCDNSTLTLSGLDVLKIERTGSFVLIGERCNVAGSRKFLRLVKNKNYDEALNIARKQIEDGAHILDVNVDDGLLDGVTEITNFLNLLASEPDIARVPVMIDSSDWAVIEAGLKCLQGKSIVNSISLKNGEYDFLYKARKIKSYGAAVVAMAFDEKGQADTYERKIEVCERMYRLLIEQANFLPSCIIFDPNILAIGTGIETHNTYAEDFIRATSWIKEHLPGVRVSGGVSNLSFSFRGNNYLREAIHAVFLYHAIRQGMDMGIVNPATMMTYGDIPRDLCDLIEDLIFNRTTDATERLMTYNNTILETEIISPIYSTTTEDWRKRSLDERLQYALLKGVGDYLEIDLKEALTLYSQPVNIIDGPLMTGMNSVGKLFGEGKMFLPQVVKTARTMKKAVSILQPYIEARRTENPAKAGRILIATVKGDVHDIGKNITSVILSCNNYEVIDLGVMVPPEEIIKQAYEQQVDMIALSGLITPSLQEMSFVASEMEKAKLNIPLIVGGATTSPLHTALKIAPLYHGPVMQAGDASQALPIINRLLNPETRDAATAGLIIHHQTLREEANNKKNSLVSLEYARKHAPHIDHLQYRNPLPQFTGSRIFDAIPMREVVPLINWAAFLIAWKLPVKYVLDDSKIHISKDETSKYQETMKLLKDARKILDEWISRASFIKAIVGFYPVTTEDESILIEDFHIPLLRQQEQRDEDIYRSLVDFINSGGDYIGLFTVTAGLPEHSYSGGKRTYDSYREMLEQTLQDRLVEAATEYIHEQVKKKYCGKESNKGIRPASGYSSLPDLSLNFTIDRLLQMERLGVSLTPNGALYPKATTAGLFIFHPEAVYFHIGRIGDDQLVDYARRTGRSVKETIKWLGAVVG